MLASNWFQMVGRYKLYAQKWLDHEVSCKDSTNHLVIFSDRFSMTKLKIYKVYISRRYSRQTKMLGLLSFNSCVVIFCLKVFLSLKKINYEVIVWLKRHFQLNDDVYADYVENLLNDISKEPDDTSAYGDDSKYEWWKFCVLVQKCDWIF